MQTKKPIPVSDIEKITKQFYERFKKEHSEFQLYVQGIADQHDCEWYTSLMLNRLMFLYFIQQKGFLAGDKNYLYNRLKMVQQLCKDEGGGQPRLYGFLPDRHAPYYSFYRYFLLKLFQDGLNKREHPPTLERLLGNVPYLNSGLFAIHVLERKYPAIDIQDSAFERLFNFFQEYDWYLDDDLATPFSPRFGINPDMLGSIFERFINQKEKGAYYTKEDVTEYISKNTIIPSIFEAVEKRCPDAFGSSGPVWSLLRPNFDDYMYANAAKGHMGGDRPALLHIRDLITYNLDICKFARNVIVSCERSDLLLAFYESIEATTILDPTCGSGAFLFAALRILCPLYEACLIRMQAMVNEYDQLDMCIEPQKCYQTYQIERFCDILQQPHKNHSRKYFILKSIITKNLYGVDLMEEAVEICKLRLFLKLLAQVDRPEDCRAFRGRYLEKDEGYSVGAAACPCPGSLSTSSHGQGQAAHCSEASQIPPPEGDCREGGWSPSLSDIDFNVLVGNALVGCVSTDEICQPAATLQRPFHWCIEFQRIMTSGGFSVIIGNPPYVEYNATKFPYTLQHFATLACANLYPCVVERGHQLLSPQGYIGMILPLAAFATKNMVPFLEGFYRWFPRSWLSFYHFRPSMLFSGGKVASIPTAIFLAQATGPEQRFSTNLIKWSTNKRDQLFSRLLYCPVTVAKDIENRHYYPKFGHGIENAIMEKILRHQRVETCLAKTPNQNTMWYRSAGGLYWKVFVNFPWPYKTTSNKQCSFQPSYERDVFVALFNSSLFWWYYTVTFDSFNLKDYMLFGFRFSYPENTTLVHALCSCCQRLMNDFRANAQHLKRGKTGSYTVYARKSKHIIDDIDRILARHYGFTKKELDFIINYDIRYRMGYDSGDKSEGEFG